MDPRITTWALTVLAVEFAILGLAAIILALISLKSIQLAQRQAQQRLRQAATEMRRGETIADRWARTSLIPLIGMRSTAVGVKTFIAALARNLRSQRSG
ncbi:MAG: hypothetical protein HYX89_01440 [Chloroflexi bacterium]|nr:hypothetical protein [Chloroflexota bacterium]